jgi:hypothetical protein
MAHQTSAPLLINADLSLFLQGVGKQYTSDRETLLGELLIDHGC